MKKSKPNYASGQHVTVETGADGGMRLSAPAGTGFGEPSYDPEGISILLLCAPPTEPVDITPELLRINARMTTQVRAAPVLTGGDRILDHLLPLAAAEGVGVATLTRAAWHLAARDRRDLVHRNSRFLGIVVLPRRPRWFEDGAHSPRHDFCWKVCGPRPRPPGFQPQMSYPGGTDGRVR